MNNRMLKFAVLSISLLMLTPNAISVALADITKSYAGVDPGTIALILTLPLLVMTPFTFISGILSNFMSKKSLIIIGLIVYIIGGMAPLLTKNLTYILIARSILGVGLGVLVPFTTSLIFDFFEGDERNGLIGFQSAFVNIGLIFSSLVAGILAGVSWQHAFWIYTIGFLVLLLISFKLPEPIKVKKTSQQKVSLNGKVFFIGFLGFLIAVFQFPLFSTTALLVVKQNMGNATSVGLAVTVSTISGLFTGLLFGKILGLMQRYTSVFGLGIIVVGFFIISYATNILMVYVGAFFAGIAMSSLMPFLLVNLSMVTDKSATALANAIFFCCLSLGQFASPIIMMNLTEFLGNTSERFTFFLSGIVFLVAAVIVTLIYLVKPASPSELVESRA